MVQTKEIQNWKLIIKLIRPILSKKKKNNLKIIMIKLKELMRKKKLKMKS